MVDVIVIRATRHGDARGWFQETWSQARFADHGIDCTFVQDNHSRSEAAGVVRGLHFQAPPFAQTKLVRCVRGAILDVMVDLRLGSPTYGKTYQFELTAESGDQVLVPDSFGHGFVTLSPGTEVIYKVSAPYSPAHEGGLAWNDPALDVAWPALAQNAQLSARDLTWPLLKDLRSPFTGTGPSRLREVRL